MIGIVLIVVFLRLSCGYSLLPCQVLAMSEGDPHWSEPKRTRVAVRQWWQHLGYVTVVEYPNRDFTAFPEGSPYFEIAVSDLNEKHVALFQQFKQHWLIHCGDRYDTTDTVGDLSGKQIMQLAILAIQLATENNIVLLLTLKRAVDRMLS
jgi:hypothetical protein